MATPTLDEIEAASNRIATRKSEWAPEMLAEITAELLRGLVAHVRALEKRVSGAEGYRDDVDAFVLCDRARITALEACQFPDRVSSVERSVENMEVAITALEAKAAALGNCGERLDALEARVVSLSRFTAQDAGRIAALEAKVAALAGPVIPVDLGEIHAELDRLRAENAAQSKALEEALLLGKDALFAAQAREQKLAEENAELRKRVEALTDVPEPAPQWPAPQPIETAPLGRIMVVFESGQMEVIRPVKVDTESSWREFLKMNKATHWWPMPPPPGGGK